MLKEARALLGRLEYQRGNIEAALRVFDGIDLQAAIQRLQPSPEKPPSRRSRLRSESIHSVSQHAASLVLEAIYLKSMSLQKLGKATGTSCCSSFIISVELLPELWKQAGRYQEALASYRRALLSHLALCYSAADQNHSALNLLRKLLKKDESPDYIMALLLAAKICSDDCLFSAEGVEYARRAIANAQVAYEHLKSVGLHFLGNCLGKLAKIASSDHERSTLQSEALRSLDEVVSLERQNPEMLFDLALEYAEQRNANAALRYAKEFIDATGGSISKGWRLLALVLSAQQRYSEAEIVIDAALDETAKWEQGPLLRIKAKLKVAQSLHMDAVEAYRLLLALVQAQRKSFGSFKNIVEVEDENVSEFEVWRGLANLYSGLSHWRDAEICLEKARTLKPYSASSLHIEGTKDHIFRKNCCLLSFLIGFSVASIENLVKVLVAANSLSY
ncbi:hypothetical protein BHE74_00033670 [Ensete ventricosum]|nr:hypothetical protein BHE74_00033670 [Ensete ventricosum]RZR92005.1 hypothetical protein BHM03_00020235 [Ensete ventricosum]